MAPEAKRSDARRSGSSSRLITEEEEEARRAKPPARARAGTSGNVAGASARARRDAAYEHLAGGVLSG